MTIHIEQPKICSESFDATDILSASVQKPSVQTKIRTLSSPLNSTLQHTRLYL
jgi:hypothetical protein